MSELLSTEELIQRVREETQHLTFNGRIDAQLSERTLRYYATMKYVSPPQRRNGRSVWTEDHVKDLVRIRRAQSAGQSLSEIGPPTTRDTTPTWKLANIGINRSVVANAFSEPVMQSDGWAFQISPGIQLTGFTNRLPTQKELQRVTDALSALISFNTSDNNTLEQQ
jgi:hypothetical protein